MIFHTFYFVCRWSFTPLDDAIKFGHKEIQKILESYIEEETEHTLQDNIKKEESWTYSSILTFYSNIQGSILFIALLQSYLPLRMFMSVALLQNVHCYTLCQLYCYTFISLWEFHVSNIVTKLSPFYKHLCQLYCYTFISILEYLCQLHFYKIISLW